MHPRFYSLEVSEMQRVLFVRGSKAPPWEIRKNLEIVKKVMERVKNWASFVRVGTDIGSQYHFSNLDSDTLNSIYNACDLMLVPSLEEGFGYPVAEALKVGIPVVASDIEIFREVAGDCVIYVDPQNVEDISRGLQEALENREILSKKGQERAKEFTLEQLSRSLDAMYSRVANAF